MIYLKVISLALLITSGISWAQGNSKAKKVVYKDHTQLDFTGEQIEGKVKAPAVFYIFQRKRSLGHEAARSPERLGFHESHMKSILKEAINQ